MKKTNLSRQYNIEYFHLSNHQYKDVHEIIITLISSEGSNIEAEYDILTKYDEIDGYVGEFANRELALRASEHCIIERLKNRRNE